MSHVTRENHQIYIPVTNPKGNILLTVTGYNFIFFLMQILCHQAAVNEYESKIMIEYPINKKKWDSNLF